MITAQTTIREALADLSERNETGELDNVAMQRICHRFNFPEAIVTCGIVYLEGHDTIDFPPMPIQQVAKMFLDIINKRYGVKEE